MIVHAFIYSSCVHESAAATVSLHVTKAGAWRAMRANMLEQAVEERDFAIRYGGRRLMRERVLRFKYFGIRQMEVLS